MGALSDESPENSLAAQKLEICAFMTKVPGSSLGNVTKILKATQQKKKKPKKPKKPDESSEAITDLCSASKIVQQVTSIQSQEYRLMSPLLMTLNCEQKKSLIDIDLFFTSIVRNTKGKHKKK